MSATPYEHIACCLEDSPGSRRALEEAQRLRAFGPGRLTIVHVTPPPIIYGASLALPPEDEITRVASAWLTNELERIDGGESVLLFALPAADASAWARQTRPDLLVASAHRGLLERIALGSFASYLAYHAPCPVLLVHPDTP